MTTNTIDSSSLDYVLTGDFCQRGESSGQYALKRAKSARLTREALLASAVVPIVTSISGWDVSHREGLSLDYGIIESHADLPGELLTAQAIQSVHEKAGLLSLLSRMAVQGLSWSFERSGRVSLDSANAAIALLLKLDPSVPLPKVAADGEGGVMLLWTYRSTPVLVTVDNWRVHVVVGATTPNARYFDDLPFDGESIPSAVQSALA